MYRLLIFTSLALAVQASPITPEPTSIPGSSLTPELIQLHTQNGRKLPEPDAIRPTQVTAVDPESKTAVLSPLSGDLISEHTPIGLSELKITSDAPASSSDLSFASTTVPSKVTLFSPVQISQHTLTRSLGWSLPEPGLRSSDAPGLSTESTIASTGAASHSLVSPNLLSQHTLMEWSLPEPGIKPRPIRAAPRALPAHKAHGPRALLPNGPYASRGIRV